MLDKNKRVHRPERLKGHDYSRPGCYFVNYNTKIRGENLLCKVVKAEREAERSFVGPAPLCRPIPQPAEDFHQEVCCELTRAGEVLQGLIERTAAVYDDVEMDCYVIMPDHVHLLLWIKDRPLESGELPERDGLHRGAGPASIPGIIHAIKVLTTGKLGESLWQRGYYDHIIRNDEDLQATRQYIRDNPVKWFLNRESDHSVF